MPLSADMIANMERTLISNVNKKINEEVRVAGYVVTRRDHGKIVFLDLSDRSGTLQIVVLGDVVCEARPTDVVEIIGTVAARPEKLINPNIVSGNVELQATQIKILTKSKELPFDMGTKELDLQLPTLLDFRALTLRHPRVKGVMRVNEAVVDGFRESLKGKDFVEFQSPVIIPATAEGGAEVFEVKYFEHKAYLAQSPQFYKQIMVGVFERVYTVNKTLRAEPSVTTRHLTEATTLDAEMGFIDSWTDLMDLAEGVIRDIFDRVKNDCADVLEMYETDVPKIESKIPRLKLREAQEIIFERTGRDNRNEPDLEPEDEREICRWSMEEHGSELVFVTHYPVSKRPFYTMEDPEDLGFTLSFDLLGRGTEWLTGGQRITDLETLITKAEEKNIDLKRSALYLQAFEYGMPPEGGWSFGSERIVMHILGLKNIREATPFPRDMERVDLRLSEG